MTGDEPQGVAAPAESTSGREPGLPVPQTSAPAADASRAATTTPAPLFAAPSSYRRTDAGQQTRNVAPQDAPAPWPGAAPSHARPAAVGPVPAPFPAAHPGAGPSGGPVGYVPTGLAPSGPAPTGYAPPVHPATAPTDPSPGAPRTRRRRTLSVVWLVPLVLVSLVAGLVGGVLGGRLLPDDDRRADAGLPTIPAAGAPVDRAPESIAGIAAAVLPSVVSIEVTTAEGGGSGSGFVLRQDGYVLTNNHVVAGATDGSIVVQFADGSELPGTVVGATGDYDLAVVKVEATGLQPLALGDSDAVVVGDPVVAIGAPLGLVGTVTTGIVSSLHRPVVAGDEEGEGTAFINAIQTDAAINPGNSGGPLVNARGEVVGINSAIAQLPGRLTGVAGSIGLGFAIPSNQARRTAEQLIETGRATYPVIGVLLDPEYSGEGVRVFEEDPPDARAVVPDGPADRAGIRRGDVILAVDGRPVTASEELIVAIRAREVGDTVVLRVRTGDEEREVRVRLAEGASD